MHVIEHDEEEARLALAGASEPPGQPSLDRKSLRTDRLDFPRGTV
jgi:hypothetical protein